MKVTLKNDLACKEEWVNLLQNLFIKLASGANPFKLFWLDLLIIFCKLDHSNIVKSICKNGQAYKKSE